MTIANSLEELEARYLTWESNMESKGLRVNIGKTKIMKSGKNEGPVFASGKCLCGVCNKGVGRNSIYCSFYNHWVATQKMQWFERKIKACVRYFLSNFYFSPNNSPSRTMKNVFYFI